MNKKRQNRMLLTHDLVFKKHKSNVNMENCRVCEVFELLIFLCAFLLRMVTFFRGEHTGMNNIYVVFICLSGALFLFTRYYVKKADHFANLMVLCVLILSYGYSVFSGIIYNINSPSITVYIVMVTAFSVFILPRSVILVYQTLFGIIYCAMALMLKPQYGVQDVINYAIFFAVGYCLSLITYQSRADHFMSLDIAVNHQDDLQMLLNEVPAGIGVYEISSKGLKQIMFNDGFYETIGAGKESRENYCGYNVIQVIHPDDLDTANQLIKEFATGERTTCDFTYRSLVAENRYVWVRWVGRVVEKAKDHVMVYASITNVAEHIQEKEKLEQNEVRQRELFNTIPSGIMEFFYDGKALKVISANHTLMDMVGCDEEEFKSIARWNLRELVHPTDYHLVVEANDNVEIGKGQTYDFRLFNKKTGEYRWVSCDYTIIQKDATGVITISAFLDIEDKRKAEQKNAATTQFLSRMSHDMRTPMNGILGIANLSKEENDLVVLKQNIQKIEESGHYLLGLINDTLDVQRIQSGKMTLNPEIIDTRVIMNNIVDMVQETAKRKGVNFVVDTGNVDMNWYIYMDAMRLKQIMINLLSNAIKFTPSGGTVEFSTKLIEREGMISHDVLTIRDTGIGMSSAFIEKEIFKPFSQEYNSATSQYAGSGLGLSIVKSLVELMGGHIEVESEKNVGTTFRVYLDFMRVEEEKAKEMLQQKNEQSEKTTHSLTGKNILLAEDHPLNAEIAKRLLQKVGCKITWVQNGQECVDRICQSSEHEFDGILMDIRMPLMDGLDAARAIRALNREDVKSIPIIAMTANAYLEDVSQCLEAGMNAHVAKPIDPQVMYRVLSQYLT